ncbi:MAG: DPP IV N-terminal domain-containing protein, partial [Bacteroidota bacterium]
MKIKGSFFKMAAAGIIMMVMPLFYSTVSAQELAERYKRYEEFKSLTEDKVLHANVNPSWIGETGVFWYSVLTEDGDTYYLVDTDKKSKAVAFDLEKLCGKVSEIQGKEILPSGENIRQLEFNDDLDEISFVCDQYHWTCELPSYKIEKGEAYTPRERSSWRGNRGGNGNGRTVESPDGRWEAFIMDHNLFVKEKATGNLKQLSDDGGLGLYYSSSVQWSPDSKKLMSYLVKPAAEQRMVHYIESSPEGQIQPVHTSVEYTKPGDALRQSYPRLFDVEKAEMIAECDELLPNQYSLNRFDWRDDSRAFTFEYNQRGHQVYQLIEMNASNGQSRILVNETSDTFIDYSSKKYRYDVNDGEEIIWASERDGWNHLYLIDGNSGKVKNQVTKGEWVVRRVVHVDEDERTVLFEASGREPGDPYFLHLYRIGFDGSGLTKLT